MPSELPSGLWWRLQEYVIREGTICPAPKPHGEAYDPWRVFWRRPSSKRRIWCPPYLDLVNLVSDLKERSLYQVAADGAMALDPEAERRLLVWCSRNGLLGILTHYSQFAVIESHR